MRPETSRWTAALAVTAILTVLMPSGAFAQATTTAEGSVLTPDGEPIADVQVILQYKGHIPQKYRTKTDKNGRYVHVNVYSGPYDLTFSKEGLGEVTMKDFMVRDIIAPDKPPVFRIGESRKAPPPPPGKGGPEAGAEPTGAAEPALDPAALAAELDAANAELAAGRLDEALAGYEAVAVKAPDIPEVHHDMGLVYRRKGDLARAEAEFRQAALLNPEFAEPHGALSVMLASAGNRDEAIVEAETAVELDPENTQYLYNLAVLYKDSGRPRDAETAFLKLEELEPENVENQYHLGTTLLAMGRMDEATARLEKYVETAPPDAPNLASAKAMIDALKKR
jgi:Flp pilus assembly protein TadD